MQWFFSLLFIIFLQVTPVFAESGSGVEVRPSSDQQKTVSPKSFFTSVFTITNTGRKPDTYNMEVHAPPGWQVVSSMAQLSLSPKEEKVIPVTVFVPQTALVTNIYEIKFSAASLKDPSLSSESVITVNILPHAKLKIMGPQGPEAKLAPGRSMTYNFTIINLGNGKDSFEITASSAHGEKVDLSNDIIELEVGEEKDIQATIHIPLDVSPGTKHCLTVKASSISLERGISSEITVYTRITEKRAKAEGAYKTLSSQLITHLSGIGSGDKSLGPQVEFNTNGYVTDKYWMNFNYQGPYYKTRGNYRGLSEEKTTLDFGEKLWDASLGDTAVNLSELTVSSLSEKGARFNFQKNPLNTMVFQVQKSQAGFTEDIKGARVGANIGPNNELAVNLFESDETKTDSSSSRSAEKKRIASVSGLTRLADMIVKAEYGKSKFDNGDGYKNDNAWWIESSLRKERIYADGEYIDAGQNYPGRRTDTKGSRAYLGYRLFKPQWIWVYNHKIINNPKKDPAKNWDDNERTELGTSFNTKTLPFFSFSYQLNTTKTEKVSPLSDNKEKALIFRSNKTMGHVTASIDTKWNTQKDEIAATSSRGSEYTARLNGRWQKISPWVGCSYNVDKNITQNSETTTIKKELGVLYQPLLNFYSSFSFTREGEKGGQVKDVLSFDLSYTPIEDTSFILEGEMRNDHSQFNKEWELWLTFKRSFDMPVPVRITGAVTGIIFIDENDNGVFDNGEEGVSKITILLNEDRKDTGKDGRYKFPYITPGESFLDIDISSLPVGLASRITLPYKVNIGIGKTKQVNIPLVKTAKVRGVVFEDTDKNGKVDEGERGLALIRIALESGSSKPRETFTDNNGYYSFAGVLPGRYNLKIDTRWLPERYIVTTDESVSLDLAQGQEALGLDFGSMEKERPILKTYTTQPEELPKPTPPPPPPKPKNPIAEFFKGILKIKEK